MKNFTKQRIGNQLTEIYKQLENENSIEYEKYMKYIRKKIRLFSFIFLKQILLIIRGMFYFLFKTNNLIRYNCPNTVPESISKYELGSGIGLYF